MPRTIEPLTDRHDRGSFDCGKPQLNEFLRKYALQNQRLRYCRVYVASADGVTPARVDAFYALSMGAVAFQNLPPDFAKRCPRYPMPTAHIGQLAVDRTCQGQGLGSIMLADALARIIVASEVVAARAVEVWAVDDEARRFWQAYGFIAFRDDAKHLFLPMDSVTQLRDQLAS